MLAEHLVLPVFLNLDVVLARLEQEREAGARQEVEAPREVVTVGLEDVEVMHLAETLVHAPAYASEGDDIDPIRVRPADVVDGLAEVGGKLVGVVDHFRRAGL